MQVNKAQLLEELDNDISKRDFLFEYFGDSIITDEELFEYVESGNNASFSRV